MNEKLKGSNEDFLFNTILNIETIEECRNFFKDLCTNAEIKAMAQRITVAKMLSEKKIYTEIVNETGASTATISRVNNALNYGSSGYKTLLSKTQK